MQIGIIGAENSHTEHFIRTLNLTDTGGEARVAFLYGGDDPEKAEKLAREYGVRLAESEEELIALSDAVAITYRSGSRHGSPAMKVLRAGKPLFNDKPFAVDLETAKEITAYAREHGIPVTGGSNLKGLPALAPVRESVTPGSLTVISFAADMESPYDGYWFYGIHSAELCLALCGYDFTGVKAFRNGDAAVAAVEYPDKRCLIVNSPSSHDLKIEVIRDGETKLFPVALDYQSVGPAEFVGMIETGKLPWELRHFEKAVELVEKIVRDLEARA